MSEDLFAKYDIMIVRNSEKLINSFCYDLKMILNSTLTTFKGHKKNQLKTTFQIYENK